MKKDQKEKKEKKRKKKEKKSKRKEKKSKKEDRWVEKSLETENIQREEWMMKPAKRQEKIEENLEKEIKENEKEDDRYIKIGKSITKTLPKIGFIFCHNSFEIAD